GQGRRFAKSTLVAPGRRRDWALSLCQKPLLRALADGGDQRFGTPSVGDGGRAAVPVHAVDAREGMISTGIRKAGNARVSLRRRDDLGAPFGGEEFVLVG